MRILLLTIYLLLSVSKSFGVVQTTGGKALHHARIGVAIESQDKKSKINSLFSTVSAEKMDIDEDDDFDVQRHHNSKSAQPIRSTNGLAQCILSYFKLGQQICTEDHGIRTPYWQTANERLSPSSLYRLNQVIRI